MSANAAACPFRGAESRPLAWQAATGFLHGSLTGSEAHKFRGLIVDQATAVGPDARTHEALDPRKIFEIIDASLYKKRAQHEKNRDSNTVGRIYAKIRTRLASN